jgi:hypothetical protein
MLGPRTSSIPVPSGGTGVPVSRFTTAQFSGLSRNGLETQALSVAADSLVERQDAKLGHQGARHDHGREVDRVEGPDRLARERLPRSVRDLGLEGNEGPVDGGKAKPRAAVRGRGFVDDAAVGRTDQRPLALDQRELRCQDQVGF